MRFTKRLILAILLAAMVLPALAGRAPAPHTPPPKSCGVLPHASPWAPERARFTLDDVYPSSICTTGVDSVPIPDWPGDTALSVIRIGDTVTIQDVNVFVDIHHTWMRDLRISLTVSDGPGEVVLLDLLPMDSVVNLRGWFDDDAGVSILQADTPLIGSWRPLQALNVFYGRRAAGDWTLHVYDRFRLDSGYVGCWKINVNPVVNLQGVVRNSLTRAPVRGAVVWASEAGLGVRTGSNGSYAFSGLEAGEYTILFTKADYETLTVAGVVVGGAAVTLDTLMQTVPGRWEFASTERTVAIPDSGDSAAMELTVTEDVVISDLDVTVNVDHTWMGDLDLYLVSPQDTVVHLAPRGTGDSLNGYVDCRFDDEAALSITQGFYPFTGRYRPVGSLSVLDRNTTAGTWLLRAVDRAPGDSGNIRDFTLHVQGEPVSVGGGGEAAPRALTFYGCSPNPFNARTEFRFDLAKSGRVRLAIFDLLGREVALVEDGWLAAGFHRVSFAAADLPSGLYFARLTSARASQVKKMILLK
ncbi:MAG: proprotein convertase P-domain-containing protein [bacterium]|nr:proprotein convertase P-domain-containing protein [bacterium]